MPEVSVIIPNYNHAPYLQERIDSVLGQTYTDFELILLDDRSGDHSLQIIESYRGHPKISHIVPNETNGGSTFRQWEKGIRLAQGKWIWIAESDDVADPSFLSRCMKKLAIDDSEMVFCNSRIIDENSNPSSLYTFDNMPSKDAYPEFSADFTMASRLFTERWMLVDNFIPNASAVVFSAGLVSDKDSDAIFSEMFRMKLIGDWYFWIYLLLRSEKLSYIADSLNRFRHHSQNVRSKTQKNRTTEFPLILALLRKYKIPLDRSFDAYLYRYFHHEKNIRWSATERWAVAKNAVRFGFLPDYLKAFFKHSL